MTKKTTIYIVSTLLLFAIAIFGIFLFSNGSCEASNSLTDSTLKSVDTIQISGNDLPPKEEVQKVEVDTLYELKELGIASWYGSNGVNGIKRTDGYHGRKTASGEIFNTHDLTAAHKKLKFGTLVRVTNLDNDQTVIVRINDRGPYAKGRVIDLSYAAKSAIGMGGTAKVKLELVKIITR